MHRNCIRLLREGLQILGLEAQREVEEKIVCYLTEIERWNRRFNLVKAHGEDLVVRHLLDSLVALPLIRELDLRESIADVGSGAGFPGIPLALFMPKSSFSLIERSSKKSEFLRNVLAILGLKNTRVLEIDLLQLARQPAEQKFDVTLFRALAKLSDPLIGLLSRITQANGAILAYKGRYRRIREELTAAKGICGESSIIPVDVPFLNQERHLVLIRKADSSSLVENAF